MTILLRAMGMPDWQVSGETLHATIAPDPANRVAELTLAEGPKNRRQAIEILCHEVTHAYVSQFCVDPTDITSAIRWDQLTADLVKRLDADAVNEALDAALTDDDEFDDEAFANALEKILATRFMRGTRRRQRS